MGSRLVLGASTLALVVVASGGTAILVTQGTTTLPRSPLAVAPPDLPQPRPVPTPLVVPRRPGSALFGPSVPVARPVARVVPPAGSVGEVPDVVTAPPVVEPPTVQPPVVEPPVVEPPNVEPPVVENPVRNPQGRTPKGRGTKSNKGHHYGQLKHPKR